MENHGKETHEVTAPTFFGTTDIDNPGVLNREHTEVVMQPGESKDLLLTAHKPGTYDLRCSDHDWNGMVGGITVE
jgi:plastocyanin